MFFYQLHVFSCFRQEFSDQFDLNMNLVTIDDFGGWDAAYQTYFNDGAAFDQIYAE